MKEENDQTNTLSAPFILTADIGGSHITAAICQPQSRTILTQSIARVEVDSKSSSANILAAWKRAFGQAMQKAPNASISGISIAMPGPFDYKIGISYIKGYDKYDALYGMDIKQSVADMLKLNRQVIRFRNDAESTIAGEVLNGAGKNNQRVLGVTLGTGFGSAYSENGVTKDLNLGSNPYKDSMADDYLSTRWFMKRYLEITGVPLAGGVKELAAMAHDSSIARDIFKEFAENMSEFLSRSVAQLNPQVLVICGNIAKASEFFLPQLVKGLNSIPVKLAQLGENAPLIGAAAVFGNLNTPAGLNSASKL